MDGCTDVQTDRQALTNAMSPSDFFSADNDSKCKYIFRFPQNDSTGIGLATLKMPYGHIDLGHHSFSHWLVAWWHQAIIWANVGFSSKVFCGTHLRPILHKMFKISICKMNLKNTLVKLLPHFSGANEIKSQSCRQKDTEPVFCLLLWVSSDYAKPITGQVTEVTCPVIGRAEPELTLSKRQKTGPGEQTAIMPVSTMWSPLPAANYLIIPVSWSWSAFQIFVREY